MQKDTPDKYEPKKKKKGCFCNNIKPKWKANRHEQINGVISTQCSLTIK